MPGMREFFGHASGLYNLPGLYEKIASGKIPGVRLAHRVDRIKALGNGQVPRVAADRHAEKSGVDLPGGQQVRQGYWRSTE